MANPLSQETEVKSLVPRGSVIGPLLFNDLPSVINVITLFFTDDVKMVSPRSQSDIFESSLYHVWKLSVNWDLPLNPNSCNNIAFGRAPPFQFFLASGSPGDFIKVTNVVKDVGSLMDNLFSPSNNLERSCLQSKINAVYD